VFTPDSLLNPNAMYTATLTTGIKDYNGAGLAANYVWSFSTGTNSIAGLRTLHPGDKVACPGRCSTTSTAPQAISRSRIGGPASAVEGLDKGQSQDVMMTSLSGTMATDELDGELYISLDGYTTGDPTDLRPLGANNRAVRTSLMDGLKVRVWGKVTSIGTDGYYEINDGSNPDDGILVFGTPAVGEDEYTCLNGAAGMLDGVRLIRALPEPPSVSEPGPMVIAGTPASTITVKTW